MVGQTRALVEAYLEQHAAHSMYLVTVPATAAANQSIAMDIVQRRGLQRWTIGVFTKCDLANVAVDSDDEEEDVSSRFHDLIRKLKQESRDVIPLSPHGYVGTMNKRPRKRFPSGYEALVYQAQREHRWFEQNGLNSLESGSRMAGNALIARLMGMYHSYVMLAWLPGVLHKLGNERQQLLEADRDLGLPRAHSAAKLNTREMRAAASVAFNAAIDAELEPIMQELHNRWTAREHLGFIDSYARTIDRCDWKELLTKLRLQHTMALRQLVSDTALVASKRIAKRLHHDDSPFKCGRFDAVIQEFVQRLHMEALACTDASQVEVDTMLEHFYTMSWNPCVRTKSHQTSPFQIEVEIDYRDFHESVIQAVLGPLLQMLLRFDVDKHFPIQPSLWLESCQSNRWELLERLAVLDSSEDHLLKVLDVSTELRDAIIECHVTMMQLDGKESGFLVNSFGAQPGYCRVHSTGFATQPPDGFQGHLAGMETQLATLRKSLNEATRQTQAEESALIAAFLKFHPERTNFQKPVPKPAASRAAPATEAEAVHACLQGMSSIQVRTLSAEAKGRMASHWLAQSENIRVRRELNNLTRRVQAARNVMALAKERLDAFDACPGTGRAQMQPHEIRQARLELRQQLCELVGFPANHLTEGSRK